MSSNEWRSALWNTVKSRLGLHGPMPVDADPAGVKRAENLNARLRLYQERKPYRTA